MPVHGIDDGNNKHDVYTAEEVLSILQQAIDNGTLQGIDPEQNPIVAAVRENHNNSDITFWSGTEAEFNELVGVTSELIGARIGSDGKLYLLTGDTTLSDTVEAARQAALEATEGMKREVISVTLLANGWSNTAPYTQTVAVAGMTADKDFLAPYLEPTGNESDDLAAQVALSCISGGTTDTDSVTFYCYEEKPTTTITVYMVDKGSKLESSYPIATQSTLGMVKVGEGLNVDQAGELSVAAFEKGGYFFDTVADMVAYNLTAGDTAETLGYYAANDGGAGTYKIVDSGATVDGGSIIALNNGLKAQLIIEGKANVKQFGAKGDNSTDDTEAIQNAINFAKSKVIPVYVPVGTYRISQIVLDYQYAVLYGDSKKSVLKSINNNTADCLVKFSERGILNSIIRNIYIHGYKEVNTNVIDGLVFTSANEYSDSYALIDNVEVVSCTGNGVFLDGSRIREIRMSNTRSAWNVKNGFKIVGVTDSQFYNNTAACNQECGFYIKGANHKISSCKAHTGGFGDFTTIDQARSPESAYTVTSDATPQSGKTYYTRSGTQYNDNPYVFTEFTGSSFDSGTTYYELTVNYYLRYPGFYLEGKENTITNCEAQDNSGDGIYVNGGNNNITSVLCDNNGRLPQDAEHPTSSPISYASAGLEQIYDGVHIEPWGTNNVSGNFANFRNNTIGKSQRSALCIISNSGGCNADIIADSQVTDVLLFKQGANNVHHITLNGKEFYDEYDVSRLELLSSDYSVYSGSGNASFLKKRGNRKYLRLIISKTSNYGTSDDITLTTLPNRFRPTTLVTFEGLMSSAKGYNVKGTAQMYIATNGDVQFRGTSSAQKDLVIAVEYD